MSHFKMCAVGLFGLLALPLFAQIQTGNYTLGGDINATGAFQKEAYNTNSTNFNASLSPSIGKFITSKWFLGVRPILSTKIQQRTTQATTEDVTFKSDFTQLGLEVASRYYFKQYAKFHFFGFATASFDHKLSYASSLDPTNGLVEESNSGNFLNYQIGIGANFFLNKDIAFETSLAYIHAERPISEGFLVFANTSNTTSDILINFKMTNFVNLSSKSKKGETPQYIRRGRQTLDVNGWYGTAETFYFSKRYKLSAQYSYLVTNRLMLKASYHSENNFNDTRHSYTNVALSARYYVPVKNRFFIYPQLSIADAVGYEPVTQSYAYSYYETSLGLGIGGSYFLSDNIALDATFLQARLCSKNLKFFEQPYAASLLGIGNISLLYFIR